VFDVHISIRSLPRGSAISGGEIGIGRRQAKNFKKYETMAWKYRVSDSLFQRTSSARCDYVS
jgi:hypothetical protein